MRTQPLPRPGDLRAPFTQWEAPPSLKETSFQRSRSPRSQSQRGVMRSNAGETFFPHTLRFDIPLGMNARPPGTPGTPTDGFKRRTAHQRRIESGWVPVTDGERVRPAALRRDPALAGAGPSSSPKGAEGIASRTNSSHTQAVPHKLSEEELAERGVQSIFKNMRSQMKGQRTLNGVKISDARSLFEQADRDDSGSLDMREFADAIHRLGVGLTDEQVEQVCTYMDKGGDGTVDYSEFIHELIVGDAHLEGQEKERRAANSAKLRNAARQVRVAVMNSEDPLGREKQRQWAMGRIEEEKARFQKIMANMATNQNQAQEAAKLKRQAAVLTHDGDHGGALATLQRAAKLSPMDAKIQAAVERAEEKVRQAAREQRGESEDGAVVEELEGAAQADAPSEADGADDPATS